MTILGSGGFKESMKATLIALFVALLLVGCVGDRMIDYYENGQKKWERSYKDRQLIGPVTWWYENGQKMLEKNYKDGKLYGLLIMWHENGTEKDRKSYKDGEEVQD